MRLSMSTLSSNSITELKEMHMTDKSRLFTTLHSLLTHTRVS